MGVAIGWQGHEGNQSPRIEWPLQAIAWLRGGSPSSLEIMTYGGLPPGSSWEVIWAAQPVVVSANVTYMLKTRSEFLGGGMSRVYVKFWPQSAAEPTQWNINADVPTRDGSVLLVAYIANVTFGNVEITPTSDRNTPPPPPPPPPPNTPPSPPPNTSLPPPPAGGSVPNCSGHAATVLVRDGIIVGGRDSGLPYQGRLRGTAGADVMVGTAGNDVLQGFGGNDWMCAGPGNDRLFGGPGRDKPIGGAGSDRCRGGRGTDKVASCQRIVTR